MDEPQAPLIVRVALLKSAYDVFLNSDPQFRRWLSEGVFWLADGIESELREKHPRSRNAIATLLEIKDMAADSFKYPERWQGKTFGRSIASLLLHLPA